MVLFQAIIHNTEMMCLDRVTPGSITIGMAAMQQYIVQNSADILVVCTRISSLVHKTHKYTFNVIQTLPNFTRLHGI